MISKGETEETGKEEEGVGRDGWRRKSGDYSKIAVTILRETDIITALAETFPWRRAFNYAECI